VDRLLDAIATRLSCPPNASGLIGEFDVLRFAEELGHEKSIVDDPNFWPRIYLDIGGELRIRARDGEEALRFMKAFDVLERNGAFKEHHSRWQTGEIPAHTPHHVCLAWDERTLNRVLAKAACATLVAHAMRQKVDLPAVLLSLERLRHYVTEALPIDEFIELSGVYSEPWSLTDWPDQHVIAFDQQNNIIRAWIVYYGTCFTMRFSSDHVLSPLLVNPVVAVSRMDGTKSEFLPQMQACRAIDLLELRISQAQTKPDRAFGKAASVGPK
jgi:hypothetical protein